MARAYAELFTPRPFDLTTFPNDEGVIIEAEHSCMTLRGVHATGSTTVTSSMLGTLREDPRSRAEFFALTRVRP
jgi:GTP cyclohydrolase I